MIDIAQTDIIPPLWDPLYNKKSDQYSHLYYIFNFASYNNGTVTGMCGVKDAVE
jgi:hypothetical protein